MTTQFSHPDAAASHAQKEGVFLRNSRRLSHASTVFTFSILFLSLNGFLTHWVARYFTFWDALLETGVPLAVALIVYQLQYHTLFIERIFRAMKGSKACCVILPMILGGVAVLLHHHDAFLAYWLPLSFMICVYACQAGFYDSFDHCLAVYLIYFILFGGAALFLQYNAASAVGIAILGLALLRQLVAHHPAPKQGGRNWFLGCFSLLACAFCLSVFAWEILDRLIFLAVTEETYQVFSACEELWKNARWIGQMEFAACSPSDLFLHYDLGYLAAEYGWVSILPVMAGLAALVISGACLCRGFRRSISPLALGSYLLLVIRIASYLLQSVSFLIGIGMGLPFYSGSCAERILDLLLAVIVLQPMKPKPLLELDPDDPDFDALEEAALMLLPRSEEGAAQLAQYVFGKPERRTAWQVLLNDYLNKNLLYPNDARILRYKAVDCFEPDDELLEQLLNPSISSEYDRAVPSELETACNDNTFLDLDSCVSKGTALLNYLGRNKTLLIPPFYREIAMEAFSEKAIDVVSIPNMVQKIGPAAFRSCKELRSVELRSGIETIGSSAFCGCSQLRSINLPDSLTVIADHAFADTGLEEVMVPGSVKVISAYCFAHTPLKEVTLGDGVECIESGAFKDCTDLETVYIPDSVLLIQDSAFEGCDKAQFVASENWITLHSAMCQENV